VLLDYYYRSVKSAARKHAVRQIPPVFSAFVLD